MGARTGAGQALRCFKECQKLGKESSCLCTSLEPKLGLNLSNFTLWARP